MNITVLTKADMERVFTMREAIEGDKEALALYSAGASDIPLRANLAVKKYEGNSLYMPGYAESADALGIKIVSVYPRNAEKGLTSVPATMVLLNAETGEVKALMDGTFLTRLRTGAVSGAATDLLARKDSSIFALIGSGGQAEAQLEAVLAVRPVSEVRIFSPTAAHCEAFAERMRKKFSGIYSARITAVQSAEAAIANADIITAVTVSEKPVFDGAQVKAGAHVNGVGSYMPNMQELPEALLQRAAKIYLDTRDGVLNEAGDFLTPIKAGRFSAERITGELGELALKKTSGRIDENEITVFKSTGTAILDVVIAQKVYERAVAQGAGTVITL